MLRFFKYLFFLLLILVLVGLAAAGGGLYYLVVVNPGPEISETHIESILGRESPVFYSDGQRKMGVLFEDYHRQYVTYDRIPRYFIDAIVAAEDDQFFSHFGIDFMGIARAMVENFRAGRIVQGGSTLTQQTAKNLFKREGRSYREKLKELLWALRLEYHFSKEKILEFYCNQFFVSGNGHGLGVAARYYFDKTPDALTLVESAFIAGSVKRPNYYNPFTKANKQQPEEVRNRINIRLGYVLGKMLKAGSVTTTEHNRAIVTDLEFNQGKMAFALNTMMDLVKQGLEAPLIQEALDRHGVANVSTSGVRIITSIDYRIQEQTVYALRRHCSVLDTQLRGYDRAEVQESYAGLEYDGDGELRTLACVFGSVRDVDRSEKTGPLVRVGFGEGQPEGVIDAEGLERLTAALAKHRKNRWAEVGEKDRAALLAELETGDRVYVSVRGFGEDGTPLLDLEKFGEMQGAALVLRQGAMIAMAGGLENRFYNRAIDAQRLMGSTFKPFLFSAALQLGWNAIDLLDNRRNVFIFMDRPYFPRPDHISPHDFVTMSWAGVTSENVAAVWLLFHLTDRLTPPRIRELAETLDMAPRKTEAGPEDPRQFRGRIRDRFGIVVNRNALREAAFSSAVRRLEPDFLFDGREDEYNRLKMLKYGLRFDQFRDELGTALRDEGVSDSERKELQLRRALLRTSYLGLEQVAREVRQLNEQWNARADQYRPLFGAGRVPVPPVTASGLLARDGAGRLIYTHVRELPDRWMYVDPEHLARQLASMDRVRREELLRGIQLEGVLSYGSYEQLSRQMDREIERLSALDPYSMEVLVEVQDYRVMLGLQYLMRLGKACGIESRLEPVLSFPLGSNVVSLAEAVRMYETLVNGSRTRSVAQEEGGQKDSGGDVNGLAIIDRIETPDGRQVYGRRPLRDPVFDQRTAAVITNILQNTVRYGTGRLAANTVRLHAKAPEREEELALLDLVVPLGGKTGTANRFRNAAFIGFVPVLSPVDGGALTTDGGYTVGVYTGFDDNKPMVEGTNRISGSSGALPIWSDIAEVLIASEEIGERVDLVELSFNGLGLRYPDLGQVFIPVDPEQGGRTTADARDASGPISPLSPATLTFGERSANGFFEAERFFLPH